MTTKHTWTWIFIIVAAALLVIWGVPRVFRASGEHKKIAEEKEHHEEGENEENESESPARLGHDAEGRRVITISGAVQTRIGLDIQLLKPSRSQPTVNAYGQLEEDPAASLTLRSPVAGYLATVESAPWPRLGDRLIAGQCVGAVQPRLSPVERYDLTARLMQARSEIDEINASLSAARSSYENKKRLNEQDKVVTDRALEEAEAKVKSDEARLTAAMGTVRLLEDAVTKGSNHADQLQLITPRAGEVFETLAQPGEVVESGQALLRLTDFSHLIARVAVPSGTSLPTEPISANIQLLGMEAQSHSGTMIGRAPLMNNGAIGQTFLVSVVSDSAPLRPGMPVRATLGLAGDGIDGVIVPPSAIVRYGGSAFFYVLTGEDQFTREQVDLNMPSDEGWFVSSGLKVGDRVVVAGAGTLLSEELRAQIEAEAEGEE